MLIAFLQGKEKAQQIRAWSQAVCVEVVPEAHVEAASHLLVEERTTATESNPYVIPCDKATRAQVIPDAIASMY